LELWIENQNLYKQEDTAVIFILIKIRFRIKSFKSMNG